MCTKKVYIEQKEKTDMRLTQEADYAIRICAVLDEADERLGASEISVRSGVTLRFALKILRKLAADGIVRSNKGASGGFILACDGAALDISRIVRAIEGDMCLSKCMENGYECTRNPQKTNCKMHIAFCTLSRELSEKLSRITVRDLTDKNVTASDVATKLK